MTTKFQFTILHLALLLFLITGATSIFAIHSFGNAVPVINDRVDQKHLPAGWEAAVPSHNRYYQWILKEKHSLAYDCSFICLAVSVAGLVIVEKKIRFAQSDGPIDAGRYRFANFVVGALLALFLYVGSLAFPSF